VGCYPFGQPLHPRGRANGFAESPGFQSSMSKRADINSGSNVGKLKSGATKRQVAKGVFRKEGEVWTLAYGDKIVRLRDSKGLGYIVYLLRNPGIEFHALDLIGGTINPASRDSESESSSNAPEGAWRETHELSAGGLGDAGAMLDAQSKADYRRRLATLREELEEAKERGDIEHAEKSEFEIDALTRELSRAVGLGGRERRAGSASERARLSVTRAIKATLEKIAENHAALAEMLARSIKTGTFCLYNPGSRYPVEWEFGAPSSGIAGLGSDISDIESIDQRAPAGDGGSDEEIPLLALSFAERTAFVGRETERAQIDAAVEETLAGNGTLVMLAGGAGVGKSRLALESARYAAKKGALVLLGRCVETEEPHPYLPFVETIEMGLGQAQSKEAFRRALGENAAELAQLVPRLKQVFGDIPPPLELPPQQARRYLFESVCEFLARSARVRPIFLILDDLHWADESTLSLLVHLALRISGVPVVVVGTYRDTEPDLNRGLIKVLEQLLRGGVRPIRLKGLPPDAVARILQSLCGREPPHHLVDAIYQETEGNPFFIEELFKHLIEEGKVLDASGQFRNDLKVSELGVPENVRLVVGRRLDRLNEGSRQALAAAAVIGRSFSFKLLQSVAEDEEDRLLGAIDEALKVGLIVSSSEGPEAPFKFAHELVLQTLLAGLSPPRRQRLHLRVARAIEKAYVANLSDRSAEIAHHLMQSGTADAAELARYLTLAGRHAMQAAAYEDALRHFETALARHGAADSKGRAELLSELALTKRSLGRWEEALAHWRESLDLYKVLGDQVAMGHVCVAIVEALSWAGRWVDAAQIADRGLANLQGSVSGDRARLLGVVGVIDSGSCAFGAAQDALAEAVDLAQRLGEGRTLGAVLGYRAFHNFVFLRLDASIADGLRSTELLRTSGALWSLAEVLGFVQTALYETGRVDEACKIGVELDPLARKLGHYAAHMLCGRIRTWIEFSREPDLARLKGRIAEDLEINRTAALPWIATSLAQLGQLDFFSGDWNGALAHCEGAFKAEFPSAFEGFGVGMLFRQKAYLGDRDGAMALLKEIRAKLPELGAPNTVGKWSLLLLVIEGLLALGDKAEVAELYPLAREATATGAICIELISRFPLVMMAAAAGCAHQWDAGEQGFALAMRQAESFPHLVEQFEIRRFHGQMLLERGTAGDRDRAHTMLAAAREGYERIGMAQHARMAGELLGETAL